MIKTTRLAASATRIRLCLKQETTEAITKAKIPESLDSVAKKIAGTVMLARIVYGI